MHQAWGLGPDGDRAGNAPVGAFWGSGGSVSAQDATDHVLVGAGDIATPPVDHDDDIATPPVDDDADSETAQLVLDIIDEEEVPEVPGNEVAVFTAGDNAYESGTKEEFEKGYDPTWGHPEILGRTSPTVGNHEYFGPNPSGDASPYFDYFGDADRVVSYDGSKKGYYSYDWGEWHVVALNSMCEQVDGCEDDDPMVKWLKDDLDDNHETCTLAYFHHSLFSSGEHGTDPEDADQIKTNMTPTWDALYAAGADVVISAHDHDYERFAPQDPIGNLDPERGITEFVVGTGGKDLDPWPLNSEGVFIPKKTA